VYAVIPVKNLNTSKQRLSSVFSPEERIVLTLAMLEDVLLALKTSAVDNVIVVSSDVAVQEVAKKHEVLYLEPIEDGLNPTIKFSTSWCVQNGAYSVLVLPADIPLLNTEDVNKIIDLSVGGSSSVVLAPSSNLGTNALLLTPPKIISTCFGPQSFLNHIQNAVKGGVSTRLYFSDRISADIDSTGDLKIFYGTKTESFCLKALKLIVQKNERAASLLNR
jgi:2-phospho-L-lactate guanylyltransferase